MIVYRPQRRMIDEAMAEAKEFASVDEMKQFIVDDWRSFGYDLFTVEDLIISDDTVDDDRIGWKDSRHVLTKRMGDKVYEYPQCIGYCAFEYDKEVLHTYDGLYEKMQEGNAKTLEEIKAIVAQAKK